MLTSRDFLGNDYKSMKQDYDRLMAYRKSIRGKPDWYQRLILENNEVMLNFYKSILFHTGKSNCDCRGCASQK